MLWRNQTAQEKLQQTAQECEGEAGVRINESGP